MLKEFKPLFPYLKRYRKQYIVGFFCLIVVDLAQMMIPQCIRIVVDMISSGSFAHQSVIYVCLAMTGVAAVVSAGRFLCSFGVILFMVLRGGLKRNCAITCLITL